MQTVPGPLPAHPHHVVALALPRVLMLDLAAPTHLFGHCGEGLYTFAIAAAEPGRVPTTTGTDLFVESGLDALAGADTIVVPGHEGWLDPLPAGVGEALIAAHARGARVMSICTGAFTLAAAGLLDGRRATTHWHQCGALAEQHPAVTVDPDVLYVDEGRVLTSAGVASGLDLCLHVIRRDHGAAVAAAFARRTVVAPHRDGGQAQFVARPVDTAPPPIVVAGGLEATRTWALAHLDEPLDVARLAAHACMSERTFARRFRDEAGTTPGRWILDQRTAVAQELLERTDLPVEDVATRSGFGSAASLREHLARRVRTTPTAYRRTFRGAV